VTDISATAQAHPHLRGLVARARERSTTDGTRRIGIVYPCDRLAVEAALQIDEQAIAKPLLIGPRALIEAGAREAGVTISHLDVADTAPDPRAAAIAATTLAREGALAAIMKGSLHSDELLSAVVRRRTGIFVGRRISHTFVFDLPRYHKLLALADCVVNIAPTLKTKRAILHNAVELLRRLGNPTPKVAVVAAVETVNPAIPATLDAHALAIAGRAGEFGSLLIEGPLGFDNAIDAQAARTKKIDSQIAGDIDLMIMPDLNAGNMLYKSFTYIGGGECAGVVLGAQVPIVLTSRADSQLARLASASLAMLAVSET
jgi:phosphate acetyltransferase